MIKGNYFNLSYMGDYKVFCFSDLALPNYQKEVNIQQYDVGDIVPIVGYNYFFGPNLIIIDYINKVFHIIVKSIYRETIKVKNHSFKVCKKSLFNRMDFDKVVFIDIYGNFMNISTYADIILSMISYPKVNIYLDENKYCNKTDDVSQIIVSELNCLEFDRRIIVKGSFCNSSDLGIYESNKILSEMKNALLVDSIEEYRLKWINTSHQFTKINVFLNQMRLMYLASQINIRRPFSYCKANEKYYTHIGKINRFFNDFILENGRTYIFDMLDVIFTYGEFEVEYEDFIIDTMSNIFESVFNK